MALDFGSSASLGSMGTGILGAGLGLASQFSNGNLAPGAQQGQVNQTQSLSPWMQSQWQNAFNAQNAAANRTSGQAIAGLTPAQLQAMQGIQGSVGYQMPAMQTAQNNAQGFAGGIGPQQIQNFMNPFTQSAVQSTLNTMNQQMGQQDAAISGQATQANAFGGDRAAVAQALNDQNWNLAEGQTISNLNNQGYQSAVNSALNNQYAGMQGNAQFQNAIMNNIGANTAQYQNLLGVGNQQQVQNQNVANWPIQAAQLMGQNLNPSVGKNTTGYNNYGTMQNPITGAITGLNSGLQLGNQLNSLLGGGNNAYNALNQNGGGGGGFWSGPSANDVAGPGAYAGYTPQPVDVSNSLDNLFGGGGFNSAGGEAANQVASDAQSYSNAGVAGFNTGPTLADPGMADVNAIGDQTPNWNISGAGALGAAGSALGLYSGLEQGGVGGYLKAGLSGANLVGDAANAGLISGVGTGAGSTLGTLAALGPALGVVGGMYALGGLGSHMPGSWQPGMVSALNQGGVYGGLSPQSIAYTNAALEGQSVAGNWGGDTGGYGDNIQGASPQLIQALIARGFNPYQQLGNPNVAAQSGSSPGARKTYNY